MKKRIGQRNMGWIKRWFNKVLILMSILLITFLLLEVVLRLIDFSTAATSPLVSDHFTDYRIPPLARVYPMSPKLEWDPLHGHANLSGHRDYPYREDKSPGTLRILMLGDSFLYGSDLFHLHFAKLFEDRLLRRFPGRPVEVLNSALWGWTTRHESGYYRHYGRHLDPDIVILAYYVGNDTSANQPWAKDFLFMGIPEPNYFEASALWNTLRRYSHFVRHAAILIAYFKTVDDYPSETGADVKHDTPSLTHEQAQKIAEDFDRRSVAMDEKVLDKLSPETAPPFSEPMWYFIQKRMLVNYEKIQSAYMRSAWIHTEQLLKELKAEVLKDDSSLYVLIIPAEIQIDEGLKEWTLKKSARSQEEFDFDLPQKRLTHILSRLDIPYLDLLGPFRSAPADGTLYTHRETHWNLKGMRLAAEELEKALLKTTKIPP